MEKRDNQMTRRTAIKVGLLSVASAVMGQNLLFDIKPTFSAEKKRLKVIAINGSPRKDMNTATLLEQALMGAEQQGADTTLIHLYDLQYKGCVSCLACKLKDARTNGLCAYHDALTPVLKQCAEADVLIFGSPIYYDNVNGMMRAFLERLMFPIDPYTVDEKTGKRNRYLEKTVPVGFIYTMNCPEGMRERYIGHMFRSVEGYISRVFGSCETVYSTFTYQFKDYSLYDVNMMREEDKRAWREKQFPIDKQRAFDMGKHLVEQIEV